MKKLLFAVFASISTPVLAQQGDINALTPQIAVGARGEVKVVPDRATIQISVQTRAATAAAAADENARKQKAVIDALRALGIAANDIGTSGYTVYPEQRYEPNKEPVVIGYNVTNTLSVELKSISLVGRAIDVALAKGANMITSLQFYASNTESARQEAIAIAVKKAKSDAEAAARAAGGSISGLLEISIGSYSAPPPRPMVMRAKVEMSAQADTPIEAGDQVLAVDISTRWRFVPNAR
ncbi:MAG: SIMPL domain-containing protein [Gemmatimonadales bacterium]